MPVANPILASRSAPWPAASEVGKTRAIREGSAVVSELLDASLALAYSGGLLCRLL
ncbi:hypothetical protein [Thalassoglobus sp.]|uniref:hypothetical protein n=1 Tax=Thalassoglobus sp. TaxID=2795869 RepID=UPI003AA97F00